LLAGRNGLRPLALILAAEDLSRPFGSMVLECLTFIDDHQIPILRPDFGMAVDCIVVDDDPTISEGTQIVFVSGLYRDDQPVNGLPLMNVAPPTFPNIGRTNHQDANGLENIRNND